MKGFIPLGSENLCGKDRKAAVGRNRNDLTQRPKEWKG